MPVTIEEKIESRQSTTGQNASVDLVYTVRGTDDDLVVKSTADTNSPHDYDGLSRETVLVAPGGSPYILYYFLKAISLHSIINIFTILS